MNLWTRIEAALGQRPMRTAPLSGGCVSEVYRIDFFDGSSVVAKVDATATGQLETEARMLVYLAPHLPVPEVLSVSPDVLLLEFISGTQPTQRTQQFAPAVEQHAAALLAHLHGISAVEFGFEYDTLIGGLDQPNRRASAWLPFFAEHRLLYMAGVAHRQGRLPAQTRRRVEVLAGRLDRFLTEPRAPALLHGDIWSGNVLAGDGRITGFLDPAIYFGHPEIELAFITMFSTFGESFFEHYAQLGELEQDFMAERRHLYNLYPYLVHVALFGGAYERSVEQILRKFGC